jgi:hypothetical protein
LSLLHSGIVWIDLELYETAQERLERLEAAAESDCEETYQDAFHGLW